MVKSLFYSQTRQIVFTEIGGRTIYDFRTGLVQFGEENWRSPDDLNPTDLHDFHQLIYYWERIVLERGKKVREAHDF